MAKQNQNDSKDVLAAREVGPRIRLAMSKLTEREQHITQDCLEQGRALADLSIYALAGRHNVSTAMIVKLSRHLGFDGFKQLKRALVEYSQLPEVDLHEELSPSDDTAIIVEKVFKTSINALRETLEVLDYRALERAAEALRNASAINLFGIGGSAAIALDAHHRFLRIGIRSYFTSDSHFMAMTAALLDTQGVVLGISHSGRTHALVEAFRLAKQRGATTILITNTTHSATSQYADILLCSVAQGSPITGENAAARVAQLNILDVLFVLVAKSAYAQSLENLSHTIDAVASLRA